LQNASHDTRHDQANSFRLVEIFRADVEFNTYNMYVHVRYFGVIFFNMDDILTILCMSANIVVVVTLFTHVSIIIIIIINGLL
jgi:hypothetical protein